MSDQHAWATTSTCATVKTGNGYKVSRPDLSIGGVDSRGRNTWQGVRTKCPDHDLVMSGVDSRGRNTWHGVRTKCPDLVSFSVASTAGRNTWRGVRASVPTWSHYQWRRRQDETPGKRQRTKVSRPDLIVTDYMQLRSGTCLLCVYICTQPSTKRIFLLADVDTQETASSRCFSFPFGLASLSFTFMPEGACVNRAFMRGLGVCFAEAVFFFKAT